MFEKCPNCLKRVIKGSKFCTHCGEKMPYVAKTKRKKVKTDFIDVDFTDSKKILNRYKSYFLERLKEPTVSMKKSMQKESFQFGLLQLIILVIINSFTVLMRYGRMNSAALSTTNMPLLSLFTGTTILQAFFLLSMAISLYFATNYLKNVPTTFQTIVSRIGGLATPQLMLSIILFLSVALKISFLANTLLILILLISLISLIFYLMSIKNNSAIPVFYTMVLAIAFMVALQMIGYSLLMRFSTNPQIYPKVIQIILGLY